MTWRQPSRPWRRTFVRCAALAIAAGNLSTHAATEGLGNRHATKALTAYTNVHDHGQSGPSTRIGPLTITEIMYYPAEHPDGRDGEFVEILNTDPVPHDIGGYRLSGDIDFTFADGTQLPAHGRIVVAADPQAIVDRYPVSHVLGPYSNRLSNGGGTLRLRNQADALLFEVTYDDDWPWPTSADGAGHALVLARPDCGENERDAWSAGSMRGGTPGQPDSWTEDALSAVVVNEFLAHTDLPQTDFIELYNRGTQAVDIAGCVLTDDPATNRFVIPAGTVIPPGGHLSYHQDTLGFSLSMHGDDVFLVDTNGNRVLDAVRFPPQANGIATGRYPDGAGELRVLSAPSPGSPNAGPRAGSVIINEIMFNPISSDSDDEYIELHNTAATNVDIGHWRFTEGVAFTFPPGTVLPADGYLVVARDAARLIAKYPRLDATNTLGDFDGRLSDRGERIVLARPDDMDLPGQDFVVVDTVAYNDGWGRWADGDGSSLELIDSHGDNRRAMNWAGSDETAKAPWTDIEHTGVIDNASGTREKLHVFFQQGGAECLLDDIEVLRQGETANRVSNGTFETGLSGWELLGTHERSSLATHEGYTGGRSLHARATSQGRMTISTYRITYDRLSTVLTSSPEAGQTFTIRAKGRWLAGWPYVVLGIKGHCLEAVGALQVPPDLGTPGLRNSRAVSNAGPAISDVLHAPLLPGAFEDVLVSCRATDPDGTATVALRYRVDPAYLTNSLPMHDDGTAGDAVAGDGVYSAVIPGQAAGDIAAFSVQATDGTVTPQASRFPEPPLPGMPGLECLVRFGETGNSDPFGTYRLWVTDRNAAALTARPRRSNEPVDCTFVYGNQRVIYNADMRYRGNWRTASDYSDYRTAAYVVNMAPGTRFLGDTEVSLDFISLQGANRTLQQERHAYWMARELGMAAVALRFVHVSVNGSSLFRHDFFSPSRGLCAAWYGDDDAHVYEQLYPHEPFGHYATDGGVKKQAKYRYCMRKKHTAAPDDDFSAIYAVVDALRSADDTRYVARVSALADIRNWAGYWLINRMCGNGDHYRSASYPHNLYTYVPRFDRSRLHVNDTDGAFRTVYALWPDRNYLPGILFAKPEFRRIYWRLARDLAYGPMSPDKSSTVLNHWHSALTDAGLDPTDPRDMTTWIAARRNHVIQELAPVTNVVFHISTPDTVTPTAPVVVAGQAPIGVVAIQVNGHDHAIKWVAETTWEIRAAPEEGTNTLTFRAFDEHGDLAGSDTLDVTYTGNAVTPGDDLVISEIMYNAFAPHSDFVELHNLSATDTVHLGGIRVEGVDCTIQHGRHIEPGGYAVVAGSLPGYQTTYGNAEVVIGEYSGNLDNGGEAIRLLVPEGSNAWSMIDEVRYDDAPPWPAPADGRGPSLQLVDTRQDNSRIGNWAAAPMTTQPEWRYAAVTGQTVSSGVAAAVLHLYLGSAGTVVVDDVRLVQGTDATAGSNLLDNAGFETSLTGTWTLSYNHDGSSATHTPVHGGSNSLRLVATGPGNSGRFANSVNQGDLGLIASTTYSAGLWYYQTTADAQLTIELSQSDMLGTTETRHEPIPLPTSTPGAPNNVAAALPPFPSLWINEVMPSNANYTADNHGEFEPWIELFNADTGMIDLTEYYLSNNGSNPAKWAFPTGQTIAADARLLIWADGEPGETEPGFLHAGFRLNSVSGRVVLAREYLGEMIVLDALEYDRVGENFSLGSYPEGDPASRLILHAPTPGLPNSQTSQVTTVAINEWMADNDATLADPADGDYDDWFELYNYGAGAANLGGYSLTDTPGNTVKHVIPGGTVLAARDHLLVWADGEAGQTVPGGDLHVDFNLSKGGERIGLYAPDGTLVDEILFDQQVTDVGQGRWPDGSDRVYIMLPPTPGATNSVLFISGLSGDRPEQMTIDWNSESGAVYRVERRDSLSTGPWNPVGAVTALSTSASIVVLTPGIPARFYRIQKME